ncbi:GNAT family N-acetyltransferase [Polycladospora coralii]
MEQHRPVRFLEGKRIYLRPVELADARPHFQILFDTENRRLTGTQRSFTPMQIEQYIEQKTSDESSVWLLIALRDTDEVIGDIALQDIDNTNRNANIRIAINHAEHKGKGFGSEAMKLMLNYGFGILNLHRIELNVFAYNEHARRTYEKLGFEVEGIAREALYYDHAYHDSINMSILKREFQERYLADMTR